MPTFLMFQRLLKYNFQVTWPAAATECCKKNMTLMTIETIAEKNCLANEIFKSISSKFFETVFFIAFHVLASYWGDTRVNWWLSLTDNCNEGQWYWCYGNNQVRFIDKSIPLFNPGEPNNAGNAEHCGVMATTTPIASNDVACGGYSFTYICEVFTYIRNATLKHNASKGS